MGVNDKDTEARTLFESVYLGGNIRAAGRRNEHGDYVLPSIQDAWAGWREAYKYLKEANLQSERGDKLRGDLEYVEAYLEAALKI